MNQLHDFVLGTEEWDIFRPLIEFVTSSSHESGILAKHTSENTKAQMDSSPDLYEMQNSSLPDLSTLKQFKCDLSSSYDVIESNFPDIEDATGILLSPDFPQDYPNEFICGWNLKVPAGTHLTLQFWAFDIEVKIMMPFQILCYYDPILQITSPELCIQCSQYPLNLHL